MKAAAGEWRCTCGGRVLRHCDSPACPWGWCQDCHAQRNVVAPPAAGGNVGTKDFKQTPTLD